MIVYRETLVAMFQHGLLIAEESCFSPDLWGRGKEQSMWQHYRGPDCAPFNAYMRYQKERITLSNINGVGDTRSGEPVRKGRMPIIIEALFTVTPFLIVESVVNTHLITYLRATGFEQAQDESYSFYKRRET